MATVRIGSFNIENLFARYQFNKNIDPQQAVVDGWRADQRHFDIYDERSKKITAKTILAAEADVLALQEVENLDTLKRFRDLYLGGRKAYPHVVAIDGNDPRFIDVAVLSRFPLVNIRSYQYLWVPAWKSFLFSRDCLEMDVQLPGSATVTLYVNHFKSMLDNKDPANGRRKTRARREKQAQTVQGIVTQRYGEHAGHHPFIVLGDLNDYLATDAQGTTGIAELVQWDQVVNVVDRLPPEERWSHFFKGNPNHGLPPAYRQLDYLLLSKALADVNGKAPHIERQGMPRRADRYTGSRFPGIGKDRPKASDHCPVVMELTI
jgi:predicted extracellular nuclease